MKYECKHAYEMVGIPYIMCGRESKPSAMERRDMYHSLCPYQRFCGKRQCAVLLPEWTRCKKNAAEAAQKAEETALHDGAAASTPKKKSAQKGKK